jgi:hypothetical protein
MAGHEGMDDDKQYPTGLDIQYADTQQAVNAKPNQP